MDHLSTSILSLFAFAFAKICEPFLGTGTKNDHMYCAIANVAMTTSYPLPLCRSIIFNCHLPFNVGIPVGDNGIHSPCYANME